MTQPGTTDRTLAGLTVAASRRPRHVWRRALAGELPAAEASVLMERLWRVYRHTALLPGAERC